VTVAKHGRPAAVLNSPDDLESLEETLDILFTPGALRRSAKPKRRLPKVKPSTNGQSEPTSPGGAIAPRARDSRPVPVEFAASARRGVDRLPEKAAAAARVCFGPLAATREGLVRLWCVNVPGHTPRGAASTASSIALDIHAGLQAR